MKYIGELTTDGYGMMLISSDLLTEYLKNKKIRAKKLISYLQKNMDLFFELIKKGKIVPFYQINRFEYHIFVSIDKENPPIPEGFQEVFRYENLFAEVGALNQLCLTCFDDLDFDFEAIKQNQLHRSQEIPSGYPSVLEPYTMRYGIDIPQGRYEFDLIGLEKIEKGERKSKNYGYAFVFRRNENAENQNFTICDNEENTYKFNVPQD